MSPHVAADSKLQAAWVGELQEEMVRMGWKEVSIEHAVVADLGEHRADVDSRGRPKATLQVQHPVLCGCDVLPELSL